jgi:hypothetical protein
MITVGSTIIVGCSAVPHRCIVAICHNMAIGGIVAAGSCAIALIVCAAATRSGIGTHGCGEG